MEKILLAYGLSKETFTSITKIYKNTKAMACSPVVIPTSSALSQEFFKEDTIAPRMFIIGLDYIPRTSIDQINENGFTGFLASRGCVGTSVRIHHLDSDEKLRNES